MPTLSLIFCRFVPKTGPTRVAFVFGVMFPSSVVCSNLYVIDSKTMCGHCLALGNIDQTINIQILANAQVR